MKHHTHLYASTLALLALSGMISPLHAQSFLSRLGQAVSNAVVNKAAPSSNQGYTPPSFNDGLHSANGMVANWDYPKFAPDTLDGYTHLRFGNAALDQFGNGVGGRQVCDQDFVGHNLFHAQLSPRLQTYCVGQEQLNDTRATLATIQARMKALEGLHKFYIRGTLALYIRQGPNLEPVPAGQVLVVWNKNSVPINPPYPTSFLFTGPNWDTRGNGDTYHFLTSMTLADASKAGELSYIFFTVGEPTRDPNPGMKDISITVDKIVVIDDQSTYTLTPMK